MKTSSCVPKLAYQRKEKKKVAEFLLLQIWQNGQTSLLLMHAFTLYNASQILTSLLKLSMKLSCMGETHFHYQDKIPPIDSILGVSSNMRVSKKFCVWKFSYLQTTYYSLHASTVFHNFHICK